jgi:hypothetical protein
LSHHFTFHPVFSRQHKKVGSIIGVCLMVFGRLHMLSGLTTFPAQVFSLPLLHLPHLLPHSPITVAKVRPPWRGSSGAARHDGRELRRVAIRWSCGGGAPAKSGGVGGSIAARWRASMSHDCEWRVSSAGRGAGRARATHQLPHRHARGTPPPSPRDPAPFFFEPLLLSPCQALA